MECNLVYFHTRWMKKAVSVGVPDDNCPSPSGILTPKVDRHEWPVVEAVNFPVWWAKWEEHGARTRWGSDGHLKFTPLITVSVGYKSHGEVDHDVFQVGDVTGSYIELYDLFSFTMEWAIYKKQNIVLHSVLKEKPLLFLAKP